LFGEDGVWDNMRTPSILRPKTPATERAMAKYSRYMIATFNHQYAEGFRESIRILPLSPHLRFFSFV